MATPNEARPRGIPTELLELAEPIGDLRPYARNPRRGNVQVIAESLAVNGQYRPVVANRRTGEVLAGNHTLQAAIQLGWTHLAATWVDADDEQAARIVAVDNRANDLAGYDDAVLAELLSSLPDLTGTGYNQADLDVLLGGDDTPLALTDPDDVPAKPKRAVSVEGDVWLLGPHRLAVGDSTDLNVAEKATGGRPVDLLWTDPPYGVAYVGKTADALTIQNDALDGDQLQRFLTDAFTVAWTVMRPGAAYYVAGPAGLPELAFRLALRAADLPLRQAIVWVKDRFTLGRQDYQWQHESIMYGLRPGADETDPEAVIVPPHFDDGHDTVLYGWKLGAGHTWEGGRKQTTVWDVARPSRNAEHPTMKPVALVLRAIENSSRKGGLVLDLFGGSGTTLIAAHTASRIASLVELDPKYADVICRRYQEHTGIVPINERTGGIHDFTQVEH